MDNHVVQTLLAQCAESGYVALAFNFRGVGASEGAYGYGQAEQADVRAAVAFLRSLEHTDGRQIGLVGYSFGAWVALNVAATEPAIACVAAICPPTSMYSFDMLKAYPRPVVIVLAEKDQFCSPSNVHKLFETIRGPCHCETVSCDDHFLMTRAYDVSVVVCRAFQRFLPITHR